MELTYYYTNDCGVDMLMKKVRDPKKGVLTGFVWNAVKKKWVEAWENCAGYFFGFDPATEYDEAEAVEYMVEHGLKKEEAEAVVKKDRKG